MLEIDRLPKRQTWALVDLDGRIQHDGRWGEAAVQRRQIDEWLEARSRLTVGLRGAVELARFVAHAADQREDAAGMRVERHQRAVHLRHLPQHVVPGRGRGLGRLVLVLILLLLVLWL